MKTADLQADVEYSTCYGHLVVPVEPVHAKWYRVYDPDRDTWELVNGNGSTPRSGDPWSGCHKPRQANKPPYRRTRPGVLVDRYDYDRKGRRIGGTAERIIVRPEDIVGTWKEYLALYADAVKHRVDEARRNAERNAARDALRQSFAEANGVPFEDVYVDHYYKSDEVHVKVTHRLKVPHSRAKNPPHEFVRVAKAQGLEVSVS